MTFLWIYEMNVYVCMYVCMYVTVTVSTTTVQCLSLIGIIMFIRMLEVSLCSTHNTLKGK